MTTTASEGEQNKVGIEKLNVWALQRNKIITKPLAQVKCSRTFQRANPSLCDDTDWCNTVGRSGRDTVGDRTKMFGSVDGDNRKNLLPMNQHGLLYRGPGEEKISGRESAMRTSIHWLDSKTRGYVEGVPKTMRSLSSLHASEGQRFLWT